MRRTIYTPVATPLAPAMRAGPALVVVVLAFAFTLGFYQLGRAYFHPKQGLDFTPEWIAARMLVEHGDLRFYEYDVVKDYGRQYGLHGPAGPDDPVVNFAYPPWLPPAYVPIARLPWNLARKLWFLLSAVATFGAAALAAAALAPRPDERGSYALGGVAAACFFFPVSYGLMAGQANDLPLLGIAASLYLLRSGRPFAAGLVLAPAGLWKIFTAAPALCLVARREWRALAGLAVGCAALVLASLPFVGVQTWIDWVHYIREHNQLAAAALRNHSIAGNVWLLFQSRANEIAAPLVNAPDLVPWITRGLAALCTVVMLGALVPSARRDDPRYALQFGLPLVLGVLLVAKGWEHYGIFLLPAFYAAFEVAQNLPLQRGRIAALVVLGAAFSVWAFAFQFKAEYLALASGWKVLLLPMKMYASMALLGLGAWLAYASRPAVAEPPRP